MSAIPSRRKKTSKPDPRRLASQLRELLAKAGLDAHPQLVLWIFENHKILHWIRWNDSAWITAFSERLKDPEYLSFFEARRKEPAWSEWQEGIQLALEKIAPLAEEAKKLLAIEAIFPEAHMERWRELETEKEAIAEQSLALAHRCEELKTLLDQGMDIRAEMNSIGASLTANEARLNAIDQEQAPLNREIDLVESTYPQWFGAGAGRKSGPA